MADIIDLDFYRKFRIILPVRPHVLAKQKSYTVARTVSKRYRRKQKIDPDSKNTKKELEK